MNETRLQRADVACDRGDRLPSTARLRHDRGRDRWVLAPAGPIGGTKLILSIRSFTPKIKIKKRNRQTESPSSNTPRALNSARGGNEQEKREPPHPAVRGASQADASSGRRRCRALQAGDVRPSARGQAETENGPPPARPPVRDDASLRARALVPPASATPGRLGHGPARGTWRALTLDPVPWAQRASGRPPQRAHRAAQAATPSLPPSSSSSTRARAICRHGHSREKPEHEADRPAGSETPSDGRDDGPDDCFHGRGCSVGGVPPRARQGRATLSTHVPLAGHTGWRHVGSDFSFGKISEIKETTDAKGRARGPDDGAVILRARDVLPPGTRSLQRSVTRTLEGEGEHGGASGPLRGRGSCGVTTVASSQGPVTAREHPRVPAGAASTAYAHRRPLPPRPCSPFPSESTAQNLPESNTRRERLFSSAP